MSSIYFLIGASVVFIGLLIALGWVILTMGGGKAEGGTSGTGNREDAINNLLSARQNARENDSSFARNAEAAEAEAMQREIEAHGNDDPQKAANNLRHLIDT